MGVRSNPKPRRRLLSWSNFSIILLVVVLIVAALELIPANDYLLLPGEARSVEPMISVQGHPNVHFKGDLMMTDVSLYKVDHLLEEIYGRVNPQGDLEPAQNVTGGLSDRQYQQLNVGLMTDSIDEAKAAALRVASNYKLRFSANGPLVVFLLPGLPASKFLRVGDHIRAINGHRVRIVADVSRLIKNLRPGQTASIVVNRHGKLRSRTLTTVPSTNGTPAKHGKTAIIGVQVQDQIVFPLRITINAGNIAGPSAGLMFSLGIIQRVENRDLAHGCKVAGTGTIDFNGNVGAIGGAKQKIIAAQNAGAKYFLVPDVADNTGPARENRGSVTVVPVRTLRQALRFLDHLKPCR
jgi:Lon-like protease